MSRFGLNGYECEMTPVDGGFKLSAWDPHFPAEVRVDKDVKASELEEGLRPEDRAQVERLFAPLFDELDKQRDDRKMKQKQADLKEEQATNKAGREARSEARKNAETTGTVAKDGTAPNGNLADQPGSDTPTEEDAKPSDDEGTVDETQRAADKDRKASAKAIRRNAGKSDAK